MHIAQNGVGMKSLTEYDTQLFHWLFKFTSKQNCKAVALMSKTGDGYLYFFIGLALWLFEPDYGQLFLFTALMAYALELPVYVVLKKLFKRPRPCDLLNNFDAYVTPSDKFSLPSGHTAAAWLMASIVAHFYPPFAVLAYTWASLIGLSRILLGVHYPSDVIAGASLGIFIASISIAILG
jgi:undecaprenyl-diphosphatase